MKTLSVSEARVNLNELVDEVVRSHHPSKIAGKNANAVLISEKDWIAIQETLYLLSIPRMLESIKEGQMEPLNDASKFIEW